MHRAVDTIGAISAAMAERADSNIVAIDKLRR
jgi:hypothetical protein